MTPEKLREACEEMLARGLGRAEAALRLIANGEV